MDRSAPIQNGCTKVIYILSVFFFQCSTHQETEKATTAEPESSIAEPDTQVIDKVLFQKMSQGSLEDNLMSTGESVLSSEGSVYCLSDENPTEDETITMPFQRVTSTKYYCFICKSKMDLRDDSSNTRLQVFIERVLFIPYRNRCKIHMNKNRFYEDEISKMKVFSEESDIKKSEIKKYLDNLSEKLDECLHDKVKGFSISEESVYWACLGASFKNL